MEDEKYLFPLVRKKFPEINFKELCDEDPYSQNLFKILFKGYKVTVHGDPKHPLTAILKLAMETPPESKM